MAIELCLNIKGFWKVPFNRLSRLFRSKVVSDFFLLSLSQYGGMFFNIGFSLFLTRLLSPSDFGFIATAIFIFNFFNWITEWGWEQALMAHKNIDLNEAASTHFVIRVFSGALPLLILTLFALISKRVFPPNTVSVFALLGLAYWAEKVGLTYKTVLERCALLKSLALFEFVSITVSLCVAVFAALYGFGVFSLVFQRLVEKVLLLIGYIWASPWKFGIKFRKQIFLSFFASFGVASWIGGIFGLAIYDFMPFLIANLVNVHQSGLYAKAFSMATFPLMLTAVCNRITSPIYTSCQFKTPQLRRYFVGVQTYKLLILVPIQILLAIFAPWWIGKVLGGAWSDLVSIYRMMACYGLVRAFFDDVPPLISLGFKDPWPLTYNQIIQSLIIMVLGPVAVIWLWAYGAALTMSLSMSVAAILFWRIVLVRVRCSGKRFFVLARAALTRPGGRRWMSHG